MHGARKLARDYIAPLAIPGAKVLDIACGDKWVNEEFPGLQYAGLDKKMGHDLVKLDDVFCEGWRDVGHSPDLILSVYGICTLLGEEARVWTMMRRIADTSTKFVYVGRYMPVTGREMGRDDPINGYNEEGFRGLATASGWRVTQFLRAFYSEDGYYYISENHQAPDPAPNAFAATMEPIQ
jgi:hypothetical protein